MEIKCDKKKCPFWIGFEIRYKGEKDKKKVKKMRQEAQKGFDEDRRGFQHDREKIKPEDMKRFIERSMLKFLILFISLFEFIKKGVGNRYNCKKNCLDPVSYKHLTLPTIYYV